MKKLVFAANYQTYRMFLYHFQLKDTDYAFASDKTAMHGLNHLNSRFILTDGYVVNPCFGTDRYMQVKRLAEKDNVKGFITKQLMHQKA